MEGEYLLGREKGKEYFNNGKIKFEGEYKDDLGNGNGKEYFLNGKALFSGEYYEGRQRNGNRYDYKYGYEYFKLKDGNEK